MLLSGETTMTGNLGVVDVIVLDGELAEDVDVSILVSSVKPLEEFR